MNADIHSNLQNIHSRIEQCCSRVGRLGEVTLVAVSKRHPAEAIEEAYNAGQRDFGENYAQELIEKAKQLTHLSNIRFHAIGPLQRNKVKSILPYVSMVHSVDRMELIIELDKRLSALQQAKLPVLVEVNVSGELSKSGCSTDQLPELVDQIRQSAYLHYGGLMTMPPNTENPEDRRPFFRSLRTLRDRFATHDSGTHLSMGMTDDFEIAIEEGATIVRIGTAIFGHRE